MAHGDMFSKLYRMRDFQSKRSSTWDRNGKNQDWVMIGPGETAALLDEGAAGCVRHVYWAYIYGQESSREPGQEAARMNVFRGLVFRAYWDGSAIPSIEAPLGDLFGVSNGQVRPLRSLAFTTNEGKDRAGRESWGFNCYLPMPFADGARIEIENQGALEARIWVHIDYELWPEAPDAEVGRLHARWAREASTGGDGPAWEENVNLTGDDNYTILEAKGDGQFAGYFLTVVNKEREWWGEGDDMIFIDGDEFPPSIHGTGTEEIFGGGACPVTEYTGRYTGFHCIENRGGYDWWGTNGMYRFYVADPIRFRKSIRVTLEHGHGNDQDNDYASVAFWYQLGTEPVREPLAALSERAVNFQDT